MTHPEDQKNPGLMVARLVEKNCELNWPDDLATARYIWRKLGAAINEAAMWGNPHAIEDPAIGVELRDGQLFFEITQDIKMAKYLHGKLDIALTDKEWAMYVETSEQAAKLREQIAGNGKRVQLGEPRALTELRRRRN